MPISPTGSNFRGVNDMSDEEKLGIIDSQNARMTAFSFALMEKEIDMKMSQNVITVITTFAKSMPA